MSKIDNYLSRILLRQYYYVLYPVILLGGSILGSLMSKEQSQHLMDALPITASSSQMNQVFAYKGNSVFLILFVGLTMAKILDLIESRIAQHPTEPFKISISKVTESAINVLVKSFVKFTIKYTSLYLLFHIIDNIFLESGGKCSISQSVANTLASKSPTLDQCLKYNGTWVRLKQGFCSLNADQFSQIIKSAEVCRSYGKWTGGFDISGHFCFLTTISLILFNELRIFHKHDDNDTLLIGFEDDKYTGNDWTDFTIVVFWKWVCLFSLAVWSLLLLITSVFYHTFTEKLVGLLFGYVCPLIIYFALPRMLFWNKVFN